jgi:hypothetical protein
VSFLLYNLLCHSRPYPTAFLWLASVSLSVQPVALKRLKIRHSAVSQTQPLQFWFWQYLARFSNKKKFVQKKFWFWFQIQAIFSTVFKQKKFVQNLAIKC